MAQQPHPPFPAQPAGNAGIQENLFASNALEADAAYSRITERLFKERLKARFPDQDPPSIKALDSAALALLIWRDDNIKKAVRCGQLLFCWHGTKATTVAWSRKNWPFPANGQPTAWTAQQVAAHAAQQRDELGEALL